MPEALVKPKFVPVQLGPMPPEMIDDPRTAALRVCYSWLDRHKLTPHYRNAGDTSDRLFGNAGYVWEIGKPYAVVTCSGKLADSPKDELVAYIKSLEDAQACERKTRVEFLGRSSPTSEGRLYHNAFLQSLNREQLIIAMLHGHMTPEEIEVAVERFGVPRTVGNYGGDRFGTWEQDADFLMTVEKADHDAPEKKIVMIGDHGFFALGRIDRCAKPRTEAEAAKFTIDAMRDALYSARELQIGILRQMGRKEELKRNYWLDE